jgi:hypothetical protein
LAVGHHRHPRPDDCRMQIICRAWPSRIVGTLQALVKWVLVYFPTASAGSFQMQNIRLPITGLSLFGAELSRPGVPCPPLPTHALIRRQPPSTESATRQSRRQHYLKLNRKCRQKCPHIFHHQSKLRRSGLHPADFHLAGFRPSEPRLAGPRRLD